jgi:hypothetical protein
MPTNAPINRLTSPNSNTISFGGKVFRPGTNIDVAEASKGSSSITLKASFNAGIIRFKSIGNLPNNSNLTNTLQPFNKDFALQGNNFETLFRQCNKNVESWVETSRKFNYQANALGLFHKNAETPKTL